MGAQRNSKALQWILLHVASIIHSCTGEAIFPPNPDFQQQASDGRIVVRQFTNKSENAANLFSDRAVCSSFRQRHGAKSSALVLEKIYASNHIDVPGSACTIAASCEDLILDFVSQDKAALFQDGCPNECSRNGLCVDGKCICPHGYDGDDCSVNKCGRSCSSNGMCIHGKCECFPGFQGEGCKPIHVFANANGSSCSGRGDFKWGKCHCYPGFDGVSCEHAIECPSHCSSRGVCHRGKCKCVRGFSGEDCSTPDYPCPGNCTARGLCDTRIGKCSCTHGFTGDACQHEDNCPPSSNGICSKNGVCHLGKCHCITGYTGINCEERSRTCPDSCSGNGNCFQGKCTCKSGFSGVSCAVHPATRGALADLANSVFAFHRMDLESSDVEADEVALDASSSFRWKSQRRPSFRCAYGCIVAEEWTLELCSPTGFALIVYFIISGAFLGYHFERYRKYCIDFKIFRRYSDFKHAPTPL